MNLWASNEGFKTQQLFCRLLHLESNSSAQVRDLKQLFQIYSFPAASYDFIWHMQQFCVFTLTSIFCLSCFGFSCITLTGLNLESQSQPLTSVLNSHPPICPHYLLLQPRWAQAITAGASSLNNQSISKSESMMCDPWLSGTDGLPEPRRSEDEQTSVKRDGITSFTRLFRRENEVATCRNVLSGQKRRLEQVNPESGMCCKCCDVKGK